MERYCGFNHIGNLEEGRDYHNYSWWTTLEQAPRIWFYQNYIDKTDMERRVRARRTNLIGFYDTGKIRYRKNVAHNSTMYPSYQRWPIKNQ